MPARFRKTINLGGGVKLNVNKKSMSVSAGPKGTRYTMSSTGRRTSSVGIPGTGLSFRTTSAPRRRTSPEVSAGSGAGPLAVSLSKPGIFAPKGRKQLYRAFTIAQANGPSSVWMALLDEAATYPRQAVAAHTVGGVLTTAIAPDWAVAHLAAVYQTSSAPETDPELAPYSLALGVTLTVGGLPVALPLGRLLIGLLISMLHEERGEVPQAHSAANSLPDSALARLAQADLALRCRRPNDVLPLTDGIANTDDVTAMTLAVRAGALRMLGHDDAAVIAAREALRFPSRSVVVRHRARFESGSAEAHLGHLAKARTQFEKILAENSTFPGIHEALAGLAK